MADIDSAPARRLALIMAKQPAAGNTKTRLCPPFSLEEAAELYTHFLQDAMTLVKRLPGVMPGIAFAPQNAVDYFRQLAPEFELIPQIGHQLGDRLDYVMQFGLQNRYDQVVAICSDSPALPRDYVMAGFERLSSPKVDVTLGPCDDGGYYLIGWKRPYPRMVKEVTMSTESVLKDTLDIAAQDNIRVALLPEFYDIDTGADIERLRADLDPANHIGAATHAFLNRSSHPSESP